MQITGLPVFGYLGVCNPIACLLLTKEHRNGLEQMGLGYGQTFFNEIRVCGFDPNRRNAGHQSVARTKYQ